MQRCGAHKAGIENTKANARARVQNEIASLKKGIAERLMTDCRRVISSDLGSTLRAMAEKDFPGLAGADAPALPPCPRQGGGSYTPTMAAPSSGCGCSGGAPKANVDAMLAKILKGNAQ